MCSKKKGSDIPKKYSTNCLETTSVSMSPNTMKGAEISPALKFSTDAVNLYSGLVARDSTCRKTLLLVNMIGSMSSEVQ